MPETRYEIVNGVTGVAVGFPESRADARREVERLNREAATGRTAPSEHHPTGQALSQDGGPVRHIGQAVQFEIREIKATS